MSKEIVRLEIPNSPEYISLARNIVDSLRCKAPLTDNQVDDLKLAIGEACTNAVKFGTSAQSVVRVLYTVTPTSIEIEVRNRGPYFGRDKRRASMPPVEGMQEGGMGMYLIKQVMDDLVIRSGSGLTRVRMTKKIA